MRIDSIGYHHKHDLSFENYRRDPVGDWLLLIIKTPSIFYIENELIHVEKDSFILFTPDYPQHYKADGVEYIDDWLHFEPDANEIALMKTLEIPLNTPVHIGDVTYISQLISQMCYEFYSVHSMRLAVSQLYFQIILYKLHEKMQCLYSDKGLSPSPYLQSFIWIRTSIYMCHDQHFSINKLANELALSRSRFQHIYKDIFGVSFLQDILKSRMQYACTLLTETTLSLEAISEKCGYNSVSHFVTKFKDEIEMTPSEYRKKMDKKSKDSLQETKQT